MLLSNEQFMEEAFGVQVADGAGPPRKSGRGADLSLGKGKLSPPADKVWVEKWRKDLKIAGVRSSPLLV